MQRGVAKTRKKKKQKKIERPAPILLNSLTLRFRSYFFSYWAINFEISLIYRRPNVRNSGNIARSNVFVHLPFWCFLSFSWKEEVKSVWKLRLKGTQSLISQQRMYFVYFVKWEEEFFTFSFSFYFYYLLFF